MDRHFQQAQMLCRRQRFDIFFIDIFQSLRPYYAVAVQRAVRFIDDVQAISSYLFGERLAFVPRW